MEDKDLKEALNSIKIDKTTKFKMYQNIQEKIELESNKSKKTSIFSLLQANPMKFASSFAVILLALFIMPTIINNNNNPVVLGPSPIQYIENASEFEKLGIVIDVPQDSNNVNYMIIDDSIAQISFTYQDVDYVYGASSQSGNISGIEGETLEQIQFNSEYNGMISIINNQEITYYLASWTDGKINYYLFTNQQIDYSSIEKLSNKLILN